MCLDYSYNNKLDICKSKTRFFMQDSVFLSPALLLDPVEGNYLDTFFCGITVPFSLHIVLWLTHRYS